MGLLDSVYGNINYAPSTAGTAPRYRTDPITGREGNTVSISPYRPAAPTAQRVTAGWQDRATTLGDRQQAIAGRGGTGTYYGGSGLPGMNQTLQAMNPYDEAQKSADLLYQLQQRAVNDYVAQQQAAQTRALTEGYGAVNQAMADQGILSSTGAAGALGRAYSNISDPYSQRVNQAQEGLRQYGSDLGQQTALMFQQLLRDARGEARTDRTYEQQKAQWQAEFDEAVRRGDREAAQNAYNMLSSIALSRSALADDPIKAYRAPVQPAYMTSLFTNQFLAPQPGTGPTGDAPTRRAGEAVAHYNPLEGLKSARQGDKDEAAKDRAHALAYARAAGGGGGSRGQAEKSDPWAELTNLYYKDEYERPADEWLGIAGAGYGLDVVGLAKAGNKQAQAFLKLVGYDITPGPAQGPPSPTPYNPSDWANRHYPTLTMPNVTPDPYSPMRSQETTRTVQSASPEQGVMAWLKNLFG